MDEMTEKTIVALGKEANKAAKEVMNQALNISHSLAMFGLTINQSKAVITHLDEETQEARNEMDTQLVSTIWRNIAKLKAHAAKCQRANEQQAWAFFVATKKRTGDKA